MTMCLKDIITESSGSQGSISISNSSLESFNTSASTDNIVLFLLASTVLCCLSLTSFLYLKRYAGRAWCRNFDECPMAIFLVCLLVVCYRCASVHGAPCIGPNLECKKLTPATVQLPPRRPRIPSFEHTTLKNYHAIKLAITELSDS